MQALSRARNAPAGIRLKNATQLLISGEMRAGICGCAGSGGEGVQNGSVSDPDAVRPELARLRLDDRSRQLHAAHMMSYLALPSVDGGDSQERIRGSGRGRGRKDPFPTRDDGSRAPGWSPAADEHRTRAAWSVDPLPRPLP